MYQALGNSLRTAALRLRMRQNTGERGTRCSETIIRCILRLGWEKDSLS